MLRAQGVTDLRALAALVRFPPGDQVSRATEDLKDAYTRYVETISSPGMAASLETSAVLLAVCRHFDIRSAVDLGSGFSSYVLRKWAEESGAQVFSVDDDPAWLARTAAFLRDQGLPQTGLRLWPDVPENCELVFHDLAQGELREAAMTPALNLASRFVLFDDAQHAGHRARMRDVCRREHVRLFSLRSLTLDQIKRFSMFAVLGDE